MPKRPEILLVNAPMLGVPSLTRVPISTHLHLIYSVLRSHGLEVTVFDACAELGVPGPEPDGTARYLERLQHALERFHFDFAGVSCFSSYHVQGTWAVARILRAVHPRVPIAVGGSHVSLFPSDFACHGSPFDWIVRGPGEKLLSELCRRPRPTEPRVLTGEIVPLDDIEMDWSYPYHRGCLLLSRGCPHRCIYCTEPSGFYDGYSADRAVEEYRRAADATTDGFVHVQDACFGVNRKWRRAFLPAIATLDVRLEVEVRIDQLDDTDIELLAAARAKVLFGLESGSSEMLAIMRKTRQPRSYLDRCRHVLARCDALGVEYLLGVLYNHLGETRRTLQETIDFLWELVWRGPSANLLDIHVHRYAYYPGSPLDALLPKMGEEVGARIGHPTWWHEPARDLRALATANQASVDLPLKLAIEHARKLHLLAWLVRARQPYLRPPNR